MPSRPVSYCLTLAAALTWGCQAVDPGDLPTQGPSPTVTPGGATPTEAPSPTPTAPGGSFTPIPPTPTEGQPGLDHDGDGSFTPDDCDDGDASIHPGATEKCDGKDQDCDGEVDDGVLRTFYTDADGDRYGDPEAPVRVCSPIKGQVDNDDDCDDTDASIHPFAQEACDEIDQDCDARIDEGVVPQWFPDGDGDGYGDGAQGVPGCTNPGGLLAQAGDCDDADPRVHPGVPFEWRNGRDDDCDSRVDEAQLASTAAHVYTGDGSGGWLGSGMARLGDFDGDGHTDLVLGEPLVDDTRGRARLLYGPVTPDQAGDPVVYLNGDTTYAGAGLAVAGGGDVNGDGYDDLAVGQPWKDVLSGRVTVVLGRPARLKASQRLSDTGLTLTADFGVSLGNALAFADLDQDHYDDLIIGAPTADFFKGRAHVLFGEPGGLDDYKGSIDVRQHDLVLDGYTDADGLGYSLARVGDFDGDGYPDVVISAPQTIIDSGQGSGRAEGPAPAPRRAPADGPELCGGCGAAVIVYGGPRDRIGQGDEITVLNGAQSGDGFGTGIGGVPDLNGDGYDEVIVGAPFHDEGEAGSGMAYLFLGGPGMRERTYVASQADVVFRCDTADCNLGHLYSVSGVGDVDGDGFGDLFVGAVGGRSAAGARAGVGGLFLGGEDLPHTLGLGDADASFEGAADGGSFGSVSLVDDLDGDGFGDLLMGAYRSDAGGDEAGQVYQFFGY